MNRGPERKQDRDDILDLRQTLSRPLNSWSERAGRSSARSGARSFQKTFASEDQRHCTERKSERAPAIRSSRVVVIVWGADQVGKVVYRECGGLAEDLNCNSAHICAGPFEADLKL